MSAISEIIKKHFKYHRLEDQINAEEEIKKLILKKKEFKHPCCQRGTCKECLAIEIHNRIIDQIKNKLFK